MSVIARGVMAQLVARLNGIQKVRGSNPLSSTIKTHAKGAYKTRVSFSMQNRGKLPFSRQFTLFVVSSLIAVGICSSLALKSRKPLTIAQKGFLHDNLLCLTSHSSNFCITSFTACPSNENEAGLSS